jgi:hypothetical protein
MHFKIFSLFWQHGDPIILQGEVVKIQAPTFGICAPVGDSGGASGDAPKSGDDSRTK